MTGEGDFDLILTGYDGIGAVYAELHRNDGSAFAESAQSTNLVAVYAGSLSVGDVNGDGDIDILTARAETAGGGGSSHLYDNLLAQGAVAIQLKNQSTGEAVDVFEGGLETLLVDIDGDGDPAPDHGA